MKKTDALLKFTDPVLSDTPVCQEWLDEVNRILTDEFFRMQRIAVGLPVDVPARKLKLVVGGK